MTEKRLGKTITQLTSSGQDCVINLFSRPIIFWGKVLHRGTRPTDADSFLIITKRAKPLASL